MPKRGGKRTKNRTHQENDEDDQAYNDNIPKSFIFKRGKVSNLVKHIVSDMREIMYPFTSLNLKENDKTKIKDYVSSCKAYGVSHMQIFTSTEKHNYLRFIKNPEGPTITFKIISYCTRKDVFASLAKKKTFSRNFKPPVLVMSGFNKQLEAKNIRNPPSNDHYKIVSQMVQSMFPPLNLPKAKVNNIQRVVLFSYDNEKDVVYMRHFHISLMPVSSNKMMQKVLRSNKTPNLRDYNDYSDFLNKKKSGNGNVSESEPDEMPDNKFEMDQKDKQQNSTKKQYTTRLHEIGPRLKLRLYKIEEGLLKGNVIYNRMVVKKSEEIEAQRQKIIEQRALKEQRRLEQEKNVKKKKQEEKRKEKEKEKLRQQKEKQKELEREQQDQGEFDEGIEEQIGGFDEPDEQDIQDEDNDGYFTQKQQQQKTQQQRENDDGNDSDASEGHYHGLDEDMQDFDDDFSEAESEEFIQDLERQLKKLQQENKISDQQQDDEEEEEEEEFDDEEDVNSDDEDDDEDDMEENDE